MSKNLSKASLLVGLGLSVSGVMIPNVARSQTKIKLPDPNAINKKIKQDYPHQFDDYSILRGVANTNYYNLHEHRFGFC